MCCFSAKETVEDIMSYMQNVIGVICLEPIMGKEISLEIVPSKYQHALLSSS